MRRAARALIVDAAGRVLLFHAAPPGRPAWWFAPGGALEAGESYSQALVRELAEETGITVDPTTLLAPVWTRDVMFVWEGTLEHHLEWFFLVRVDSPDVDTRHVEEEAAGEPREHRWWAHAEIATSKERFAPVRLAEHLTPLLAGRFPASPVDVGA